VEPAVFQFANGKTLELIRGDITTVPVDAIVNAANSGLRGGGGVDGAIHRAGGGEIMAELDRIREKSGGCPTGSAVATAAGRLPAKWVFHAVGPIYRGGAHNESRKLASVYQTCLALAADYGAGSISFPSISTGVYGYPVEEAAGIAMREVFEHMVSPYDNLPHRVVFVLFDDRTFGAYQQAAEKYRDGHA
jgi:O-acetyl-ADP-ribose deacetylase